MRDMTELPALIQRINGKNAAVCAPCSTARALPAFNVGLPKLRANAPSLRNPRVHQAEHAAHCPRRASVGLSRSIRRPFDVVGDVHGCLEELLALMAVLGYKARIGRQSDFKVTPPKGRTLAFVGDLVDRGPASPGVLRLVMSMARAGQALCVAGNRDVELLKAIKGRAVKVTQGMARSLKQLEAEPARIRAEIQRFLHGLASHYVLDEGRLVIAHAGLKEELHGRSTPEARAVALRGQATGKRDDYGLPIRLNWAREYRGQALVVYGHSPVPEPKLWLNNTVNLDTGCVYGGHLSRAQVSGGGRRCQFLPGLFTTGRDGPSRRTPRSSMRRVDEPHAAALRGGATLTRGRRCTCCGRHGG